MSQVLDLHAAKRIERALEAHAEADEKLALQVAAELRNIRRQMRLAAWAFGAALGILGGVGYQGVKMAVRSVLIDDGLVKITITHPDHR